MTVKVPDFVRRAIEAQGRVDPDDVERQLKRIEDAGGEDELSPEQVQLFNQQPPKPHWQDRDA